MVFPFPNGWFDAKGDAAAALITSKLSAGVPCLVGRFGSIEMESMMAYLYRSVSMSPWTRAYRFASWDVRYKGWKEPLKQKLMNNAGVFPTTEQVLDRLAQLYLDIAPEVDILGSWVHAETLLKSRMPHVQRIPLDALEPYLSNRPWTAALAGKRVLVIHPFTESIELQYSKREKLFTNPNVLPDFDLLTLRAVQSAAGNKVPFTDWFEALNSMQHAIDELTFDVAIVGAGAYGLPLAAHVKKQGKQAVHLGGATQMLFGIYGRRWLDDPRRKKLINEHWVRPLPTEKTPGAESIENGCYW